MLKTLVYLSNVLQFCIVGTSVLPPPSSPPAKAIDLVGVKMGLGVLVVYENILVETNMKSMSRLYSRRYKILLYYVQAKYPLCKLD